MGSRYERTEEQNLNDLDYRRVYIEKFDKNRRSYMPILQTINIQYPTFEEMLELDYVDRVWTMGDRYHKLAEAYYGDATYWWVIAWFNKKPTESHISPGDVIRIPTSLGSILSAMGY